MRKEKLINGGKEIMFVDVILQKIGNQKPYFSITGEIWEAHNGHSVGNDCLSCGQITEDIERDFPELADVKALHLADQDGLPMYHIENGWYWNGGTKWAQYNREYLASLLRVSLEKADEIHEKATKKEQFTEIVEAMRPRWKREAIAMIDKYKL